MTSKELVMRTLEFSKPERIPRQLWVLPWALQNHPEAFNDIQERYPDDILHVPPYYKQPPQTHGDMFEIGSFIDEWGCEFESRQRGVIGEVKKPLVKTWADVDKVVPPVSCLSINEEKVNEFCANTDKFTLAGCCPRPFERLQFLRGTENVMMDLAMESPEVMSLIDKIHQFHTVEFQLWAQTDVDSMMFMDDWGAQRSLLISPDMWRKIFKPIYADYIEIAHSHGKKVFMHSDGYIIDIIGDLIEIGLDAINSQVFCMDLEKLSEIGKGKITFWGEIDRQHLLPHGSKEDIENAVKDLYKHLYADGGVIGQLEFGPGANPENVATAFETWNHML